MSPLNWEKVSVWKRQKDGSVREILDVRRVLSH